ncbi:MAG: hypothetical protein Q7T38_09130 [Gallionella sp.]|nr:hypothetical protein [Gallionella sp.]
MQNSDLLRHQIIKSLMAQHSEKVADAAIGLWDRMASQIISIIGEDGFNSLYGRSVFSARSKFPWLAAGPLPPQAVQRFSGLKLSLEERTPEQASEANSLLLITFTDILSTFIGEELTTNILRSAWGSEELLAVQPNGVSDSAGDEKRLSGHPKELKNE